MAVMGGREFAGTSNLESFPGSIETPGSYLEEGCVEVQRDISTPWLRRWGLSFCLCPTLSSKREFGSGWTPSPDAGCGRARIGIDFSMLVRMRSCLYPDECGASGVVAP